jgi:hypothetical protein
MISIVYPSMMISIVALVFISLNWASGLHDLYCYNSILLQELEFTCCDNQTIWEAFVRVHGVKFGCMEEHIHVIFCGLLKQKPYRCMNIYLLVTI